ncbi:MAG: ribbon-helix-helix protein, CopG family [Myxococcales bacterium]|nr:ribbon-helix-helix protein, CopG family [Myxococcales bacterium]
MARQPAAAKPAKSSILSVRLDAGLKRRLDRLARASERTSSWLVQDAVAAYLETQEWQVEAIREAVRNADRDPSGAISHERVRAWVESWGSKREIERPR